MTLFNMKFEQIGNHSFKATNTAGGLCYVDYQADGFYITYAVSGLDSDLDEHEDCFETFEEAVKVAETLVAVTLDFSKDFGTETPIVTQPKSTVLRPAIA